MVSCVYEYYIKITITDGLWVVRIVALQNFQTQQLRTVSCRRFESSREIREPALKHY